MVRAADLDDLAALPGIERAAGALFRSVGMDEVADDDGPELTVLEQAQAGGRLWVAVVGDVAVGYGLSFVLDDGSPHLEQVSVDPAHGRRGLGTALVEAIVGWAVAGGWGRLSLSTFSDVAWNRPYYERLGFVVVADAELTSALVAVRRHERELGLDVSRRVIMARALAPHVAED